MVTTSAGPGPLPSAVASRYPHGYAVVDVETSGLNSRAHRVLQVAVSQIGADGGLEAAWSTTLDPGCDPGPVEIHGLTRARLAGSPQFDQVCAHLTSMIEGRVFVAHNAAFDWGFLSAETERANARMNARGRLCTMAMTRRLDIPTGSLKLAAVARYWGVTHRAAHDAADDTRVTVEILRHSLVMAHRLNLPLPITVSGDGHRLGTAYPAPAPRTPCPWRYPGRMGPHDALQQGMKVAFTGASGLPRETLTRLATSAGLEVMNSVSSRTSLLVVDASGTATQKAAAGAAHRTPVVTETTFLQMLDTIRAGSLKAAQTSQRSIVEAKASSLKPAPITAAGPLAGRRILVLGGTHDRAADTRSRIAEMGGQAAANLTASVTDVVPLEGHDSDPRWRRARALSLPVLASETLTPLPAAPQAVPLRTASPSPRTTALDTPPVRPVVPSASAAVLSQGAVVDLPEGHRWTVEVSWLSDPDPRHAPDVDVVALVVDADEQVTADEDFCFYNQPRHPTGSVEIELDIPFEAVVGIDVNLLPLAAERVIIAASIDATLTFGDLGPIELVVRDVDGTPVARATLDAASRERTMLLCTLYRRAGRWRIRSVGQGYTEGLEHLAALHGVDVQD